MPDSALVTAGCVSVVYVCKFRIKSSGRLECNFRLEKLDPGDTRYKSVLPLRGNQSQPTVPFVLLLSSYECFGFMKPQSGCTYTRTGKLFLVAGKGLPIYEHR
jgi:hypothetical protein